MPRITTSISSQKLNNHISGAGEKQVKIFQDTLHASPRQIPPQKEEKKVEVDESLRKAAEAIADQIVAGLPGSPSAIAPPPIVVPAPLDIPTEAEVSDLEHDEKEAEKPESEVKESTPVPTEVPKTEIPEVIVAAPEPESQVVDEAALQKDVKVVTTEEDYSKTTKMSKREGGGLETFVQNIYHITLPRIPETYSLLVKVAETLGQSLAARIIIDAMHDAARQLATTTTTSSSEESESEGGFVRISPSLTLAPTFEISKETYNVSSGENVTIHTQIEGAPCSKVEWFKEGVLVEDNE